MRKRSGLLFLIIGAAFLLFLTMFLFTPAKKAPEAPRERMLEQQVALEQTVSEQPEATKQPNTKPDEVVVDEPAKPERREAPRANELSGDDPNVDVTALLKDLGNKGQLRRKFDGKPQYVDDAQAGPANRSGRRQKAEKPVAAKPRARLSSPKKPERKTKSLRERHVQEMESGLMQEHLDALSDKEAVGRLDRDKGVIDLLDFYEPPREEKRAEVADRPRTRMTETSVDPKSTFSIDVDTGSYTLARARMREGYPPRKDEVRVEEFVNYFHYDYPPPVESDFAVALEAAPDPLSTTPRRHLVRVGVQGRSVAVDNRPPAHLTFLVDVSGSMFGPDQLGLVIEALDLVTRNLRPEDTIAIVEYATDAKVTMWPAGATERDIISRTIATLEPGGSSALDKGLALAYEVASTHFVAGEINRVVLLGDGRANAGETQASKLLESVHHGVEDGVELSTIGFGAKAFNDRLMEQLADNGNGAYYFVDSYREAQKVFGDYLCGTLFTIARDVKIQVEFNPKSVLRHRLLGYENRELKHHQFRNDAVDAGEIGAGHSVTAIYEVDLAERLDETIAAVSVRYKKPNEAGATELNFQLYAEELITDVRQASDDFKFAAAVAMYAEVARGTMPSDETRISLIREIAGEGAPRPEQQPDRAEFLALVDETAAFFVN